MKKKWLSRTLATMLAGVLTAGLLAGCGQKENEKEKESQSSQVQSSSEVKDNSTQPQQSSEVTEDSGEITYPLETDVKEISIFVYDGIPVADIYTSADESPWHTGLEKQTGMDVDWQYPAKGTDKETALNLLWQEEKLPTIIHGTCSSVSNTVTWLADGVIRDLTEYVPKYAPDYWAFLNRPENAEDAKNVMTDDGKILALYGFTESEYNGTYLGPVIRQDWLDECGLQAPRTLEEWENVLVTFKEKYNARFGFNRSRYITSGGISSGTNAQAALYPRYYLDDNNKVCYGAAGPEWKAMLEVLHRWYEMDLLDPDFATTDDSAVRAKVLNNEIGVSVTAMSQMTNWKVDAEANNTGAKWVGFEYPAPEVGAPIVYHNVKRSMAGNYGATISADATEEELIAALKFLNYGYTEEGMMYHNFGEEGVTYTVDADGIVSWTEKITGDEGGVDAAVRKYCGTHTGNMVTVQMEQLVKLKASEDAAAAVYKWVANSEARKHEMPALVLTEEENAIFVDLDAALNTYAAEMALGFITGKESLDKYDEFEAELYKIGLQQCLDIKQAAVDRYFSR